MSDLIYRQAAIDVAKGPVVMQGIRSGKSVTAAAVDAVKCIIADGLRDLPSAQPEPCEDAVSRQAAIDGLNDAVHEHNITDFDAVATILALPSVTPKQRTGKWIKITKGAMREKYMCSSCGRTIEEDGIEKLVPVKYPFCHCGAKMTEGDAE